MLGVLCFIGVTCSNELFLAMTAARLHRMNLRVEYQQ